MTEVVDEIRRLICMTSFYERPIKTFKDGQPKYAFLWAMACFFSTHRNFANIFYVQIKFAFYFFLAKNNGWKNEKL